MKQNTNNYIKNVPTNIAIIEISILEMSITTTMLTNK